MYYWQTLTVCETNKIVDAIYYGQHGGSVKIFELCSVVYLLTYHNYINAPVIFKCRMRLSCIISIFVMFINLNTKGMVKIYKTGETDLLF